MRLSGYLDRDAGTLTGQLKDSPPKQNQPDHNAEPDNGDVQFISHLSLAIRRFSLHTSSMTTYLLMIVFIGRISAEMCAIWGT